MLILVMSSKIVETSEVCIAVLVGADETTFRERAKFRGLVGEPATETMLEGKCEVKVVWNWIPPPFFEAFVRFVSGDKLNADRAKSPKVVTQDPKVKWPPTMGWSLGWLSL